MIKTIGKLVHEDIKSKYFNMDSYSAPNCFLEGIKEDIPPALETLIRTIVMSNKNPKTSQNIEFWENRIVCHIIMAVVRPRSFTSNLLLGLSAMMHKKHASRTLIDCLSALGLCASYHDTLLLETSIAADPERINFRNSFIQCIIDNADHNTRAIDSRNTFHAMGGIICATPASEVTSQKEIIKLNKLPTVSLSVNNSGSFGYLPLQRFDKSKVKSGLKNILIKNLDEDYPISNFDTVS